MSFLLERFQELLAKKRIQEESRFFRELQEQPWGRGFLQPWGRGFLRPGVFPHLGVRDPVNYDKWLNLPPAAEEPKLPETSSLLLVSPHCTAPHCTTLHHTAPHCTTLHGIPPSAQQCPERTAPPPARSNRPKRLFLRWFTRRRGHQGGTRGRPLVRESSAHCGSNVNCENGTLVQLFSRTGIGILGCLFL